MAHDTHHSFLFADICGYSRITEERGDDMAADLAQRFIAEASLLAAVHGAELIKGLGDGVMLHVRDAACSIRLALDLLGRFAADCDLPQLHAGVHTGPAVRRGHDWW